MERGKRRWREGGGDGLSHAKAKETSSASGRGDILRVAEISAMIFGGRRRSAVKVERGGCPKKKKIRRLKSWATESCDRLP
jgi:hypothetical protein